MFAHATNLKFANMYDKIIMYNEAKIKWKFSIWKEFQAVLNVSDLLSFFSNNTNVIDDYKKCAYYNSI